MRAAHGRKSPEHAKGDPVEAVAGLIGAVVVTFIRRMMGKRDRTPRDRTISFIIVLIAAGCSGTFAGIGTHLLRGDGRHGHSADDVYAAMAKMPLMAAIIDNNPKAGEKLRDAIRLDFPGRNFDRTQEAITSIRQTYFPPAVFASDDQTVLSTWEVQSQFIHHLKSTNAKLCREFFVASIKNLSELDAHGKQLYDKVLKAQEAVYLNGKGRPAISSALNESAYAKLFQIVELSETDLNRINNSMPGSEAELCEIGTKLYDGISTKLAVPSRAIVVRNFLAST